MHVVPPGQVAPWLRTTSHALPHEPQLSAVMSDVSHPFAFVPEGSQSAQPGWQPEYVQPSFPSGKTPQLVPRLCSVSQTTPQVPQARIDVVDDSHPSVSAPDMSQFCHPSAHVGEYVHLVPSSHAAPRLRVLSQALPHPPQLRMVPRGPLGHSPPSCSPEAPSSVAPSAGVVASFPPMPPSAPPDERSLNPQMSAHPGSAIRASAANQVRAAKAVSPRFPLPERAVSTLTL
jgi:hypothetical protein